MGKKINIYRWSPEISDEGINFTQPDIMLKLISTIDARGFLGALAMGADAVCLGTALMLAKKCPVSVRIKEKWLKLDIFEEMFHNRIYNYNVKNFMAPSTAIGHCKKVVPVRNLIEEMFSEAECILNSWGYNHDEFNTLNT